MRLLHLVSVVTILLSTMVLAQSTSLANSPLVSNDTALSQPDPATEAKIAKNYGKLPLSFEANHGQVDSRVIFLSRTGRYSLFLTGDEAVLTLSAKEPSAKKKDSAQGFASGHRFSDAASTAKSDTPSEAAPRVLRMKLHNANSEVRVSGMDELAGTSNYFIGNDPAKWRTNVPTYAKVKYEEVYSGIDLVYYGNQRQLEYDFIVAPGADPRRIAFNVSGAKQIRQDVQGELVFKVGKDEIRWHKPVVYQEKDGARQEIAARYAITDKNRVGFELAKYDASKPLYIDPLIYSTYLGGSSVDVGAGIAVDSAGYAYITGSTRSTNFPTTSGAFQTTCGGCSKGGFSTFVTKLDPTGSGLVYSTYLGGSLDDGGAGIAVDNAGNAYITGATSSADFPTVNPFQAALRGAGNAFVAKVNPEGSALVFSTYLGGSTQDEGTGITVDSSGDAYVTGLTSSTDFPTTPGVFQTICNGGNNCAKYGDAFVTKLNSAGSALVYSTYLGGSNYESLAAIAVNAAGNAFVTGQTSSTDFPTKNPLQPNFGGGGSDAFLSKINAAGSALVYSTYLGGSSFENASDIVVDTAGNAYVTGLTGSTDFPTKNPLQPNFGGGDTDAFVSKINAAGSALVYSTYLGGSNHDNATAIAVDAAGNAYVTGDTESNNFPVTPGALKTKCQCFHGNAFVTRLNSAGSALVYSTYLGGGGGDIGNGIAVDSVGGTYVTGQAGSSSFPTTLGAFQTICNGGKGCAAFGDAFVSKFHLTAATTTTVSSVPNPSSKGQAVTFTAVVTSALGAPPNGETVSFVKGTKVLGTGTLSGGSASFSISTLPLGNNAIRAVYGGDSNFAGSKSNTVTQVVN